MSSTSPIFPVSFSDIDVECWGGIKEDKRCEFAQAGEKVRGLLPDSMIHRWALDKANLKRANPEDGASKLYRPILDPYEFRLLELKPGGHNDALQGSLHHCSLELVAIESENNPITWRTPDEERYTWKFALPVNNLTAPMQYTALSYSWGPPVFEGKISCDGHEKAITRSLETALRHFRKEDCSVVFWIDQICINQDDNGEKESQIPLMSSIYRHSLNTVIWLGEASPGSDLAIRLLEDINVLLQFNDSSISPEDFERLGLPQADSESWKALWSLLGRSWFSRLWIIQEVILSTSPWAMCGYDCISWSKLSTSCYHLVTCGISRWLQQTQAPIQDARTRTNDQGDLCQLASGLGEVKEQCGQGQSGPPLLGLLVKTRHAQCYDARDRIYGLLGVCYHGDAAAVRVSYAQEYTAASLFHDMALHYLQPKPGSPINNVLTCVDHESPDLPSWVPDWRLPRETESLGYSSFSRNIYHATGTGSPPVSERVQITNIEERSQLSIRGILVDKLVRTSDQFIEPDLTYVNSSSENKTLLAAYSFVSSNLDLFSPVKEHGVFSSFWHTLVAGQDAGGMVRCPESYAEIFSLLLDETTGQSPSLPDQTYSPRQLRPKGKGRLEVASLESRTAGRSFQDVRAALRRVTRKRRLGITSKGYLGLFPRYCKNGDLLYLVEGCHVPFLLRPAGDIEGGHRLVGECYVHGIMDGEALKLESADKADIVLV
ncbi:hypothetical protein JX266_012867 [Neoarthrinium moseri]|nr:hypothetical protein JX266_012867 [Neoarthrinium moseri]